jgi:hypothetical protein
MFQLDRHVPTALNVGVGTVGGGITLVTSGLVPVTRLEQYQA